MELSEKLKKSLCCRKSGYVCNTSLHLFPDNKLELPELRPALNWTIKDRTRYKQEPQ